MFLNSPFQQQSPVPDDAEVIFVADLFKKQYVGGAELTTDALASSATCKVAQLQSKDVTMQLLEKHVKKFWVFGNFAELNPNLIPSITANLKYAVVEYDYKYCKYRSPEKHADAEKRPCDCQNQINGKLVSAFYHGADALFWMSQAQMERYHTMFPFLAEKSNTVLSSVFDNETLNKIATLSNPTKRETWIVLGSSSWVKGASAAEEWCKANGKPYEVVWNLSYESLLQKLSDSWGFVYLPSGADTCPRMVIEAKLLGCQLVTNDNVQHAKESWFDTTNTDSIIEYLRGRPKVFWDIINKITHKKPTLSGYTTTLNCVSQKYPFEQSIQSMLGFCDEVVVVDGGSTDETFHSLVKLAYGQQSIVFGEDLRNLTQYSKIANVPFDFPDTFLGIKRDSRVKVRVIFRNWEHPRFAVFDGQQKAEARKLCTGDFCWQMDSDEVVHEDHYQAIRELIETFPKGVNLLCLPVVEYWGGYDKARVDVNPWKWRLSRNLDSITHGIPAALRAFDEDGNLFSRPGSDGCDMINSQTYEPIQFLGFYTNEAHTARMAALGGDTNALQVYQNWFNNVVSGLPGVFHFSWFDLDRKIRTYKGYWGKHWQSLYNVSVDDTAQNNMMFDCPWSEVTDDMIAQRAKELSQIGGWIWHSKWSGQKTPWVFVNKSPPKVISGFYEKEEK